MNQFSRVTSNHRMIMTHKDFALALLCALGLQLVIATAGRAAETANTPNVPANNTPAIPWEQIGAKAGVDYHGEGLSVAATAGGARLHCVFQRLDGEATAEGLWLVSTVTNQPGERFRVVAAAVGRRSEVRESKVQGPKSVRARGDARPPRARDNHGGRADGAVRAGGAGGGILREHGRRAAGFCGDGETGGRGPIGSAVGGERGAGGTGGLWRATGAGAIRAQDRLQPAARHRCQRQGTAGTDRSAEAFRPSIWPWW